MARSANDQTPALRAGLSAASARLTEVGSADLAGWVDQVLAPGGWEQLRHTDPTRSEGSVPLGIGMVKTVHEQILAAVDADPEAVSVTAKANEGFQAFLAGTFVLPVRGSHFAQGQGRSTLNIRPSKALHDQVVQRGATPSRVAADYLMSCYQLGPYAPDARVSLERGAERIPQVPRIVRDAIRRQAAETGWRVEDVINEGFEKFLDGSFPAQAPAWTKEAGADMVPLKVRPNDDLYRKVTDAAKQQGLRALQVAIDYILDQYGITDGVADVAE